MPEGWRLLQAARLTAIMDELQDARELPKDLVWLKRTRIVDAVDSEIMARFVGRVLIADIIADDQKAVVYSSGKLKFESTAIPNLKLGMNMTQEMLNQLDALTSGAVVRDKGIYSSYENRTIDGLLLGVRQRMEALIVAMLMDGFSYDRLGIKMENVTWGMPSDLKVTVSTPWTNHGSAKPVDDILYILLIGRVRYGQTFNRVSMSTQAFREMIACDEFQAKARTVLAPNVSYVNLPLVALNKQKLIAEAVLSTDEMPVSIELRDERYWSQNEDGSLQSAPFQPINKVILTSTNDDNDSMAWDFANGITSESIVSNLLKQSMIGNLSGPTRGPITYATPTAANLNPPGITWWGVARGFPRKNRLQSSAVLTVGTLTDDIAVGEPF